MIKAIVSDFSRTILYPTDESYSGGLNALHESLKDRSDYNIWEHYKLNQNLLAFYQKIAKHVDVYMFTTKYIQEWPPLKDKLANAFKSIFSAARLNIKKDNPQSYKIIAEQTGLKPNEILYIDDKQSNLDVAKETGMEIIRFKSEEQAIKDIIRLIGDFSH